VTILLSDFALFNVNLQITLRFSIFIYSFRHWSQNSGWVWCGKNEHSLKPHYTNLHWNIISQYLILSEISWWSWWWILQD